jgi:hypothetical protein
MGMARAMHDTGLVSDYQVGFIQFIMACDHHDLLPQVLGLSSTLAPAKPFWVSHSCLSAAFCTLLRLPLPCGGSWQPSPAPLVHIRLKPHSALQYRHDNA